MFKLVPDVKVELLRYMERHDLTHQLPGPICVASPNGYQWVLAFFSREQVRGRQQEAIHTIDGVDFVIDCAPVFEDDLRERTLVCADGYFDFRRLD